MTAGLTIQALSINGRLGTVNVVVLMIAVVVVLEGKLDFINTVKTCLII